MSDFSFDLFLKDRRCFICQKKTADFICQLCYKNLKKYQSLRGVSGFKHHKLYFSSPHAGGFKDLVHCLKYRGKTYLASKMAYLMLSFFLEKNKVLPEGIVPIPMGSMAETKRGYNQCVLLSHALSCYLKIPVLTPLNKKGGHSLAQASAVNREGYIKGSMGLKAGDLINGKRILLIDDVYTTGATIREAIRVLETGEPKTIDVLVFSRYETRENLNKWFK